MSVAILSADNLFRSLLPGQQVYKDAVTGEAAGVLHSSFYVSGSPGAATAPSPGLAGAALTAYSGQIPFPAAVAAKNVYLARLVLAHAGNIGAITIYDRLWHNSGLVVTTTTGQTINSVAFPARDLDGTVNGRGCLVGIECSTATTNGAPVTNTTLTYCVDPDTECLTRRRGWARYDEVAPDDEILAFDPATRTTRWERPSEIFVNPTYVGDMVLLSSRQLCALVTPDHRWPVERTRNRADIEVRRTYELPRYEWGLICGADHEAPASPTYSDAFVRLVAWYVTEGSLAYHGTAISLCQSQTANPVHVEDIRRDLKEIGAGSWAGRGCATEGCTDPVAARDMCRRHYHRWWSHTTRHTGLLGWTPGRRRRRGLWVREYLRRSDIVTWLLTGDGVDAITACAPGKSKVPTTQFLTSLTREQLRMFVDTCVAGDGTPEKGQFYQHHEGRMSAFMVAATLAGYGPTIDASGTTCTLGRPGRTIGLQQVRRQTMHYQGVVWCPVTESGHWVARRRGKVFITGNTNSLGSGSKTATMAAWPATAVAGTFVPFSLAAGDVGVQSIQTATLGTSYGAGAIHLVVAREIATIPLPTANVAGVFDALQLGLPRCFDNSVPWMVYLPTATAIGLVSGTLTFAQG
ncbi:MAG: Hint domain-containing protein [Micromonosporaceae bacterium]